MASQILGTINTQNYNFSADIEQLNAITKTPEEYDEFGQGYWKNLSLYNASGEANDTQYRNTDRCIPTEYAKRCPMIQRFISDNFRFNHLKMIRARNLVDGMVIPHRDFVELDKSITYFRVFIALEHNKESFHSDDCGVFQMMPGEAWFLDAGINHAAINFGNKSRMFLCLDFMFEGDFNPADIFADKDSLLPSRKKFHIDRKPLESDEALNIITSTSALLDRHTFKDLVFTLSKFHFTYNISVACCYDWIVSAAEMAKNPEVARKARSLRRYLIEQRAMGERYVINDWNA